MNMKLKISVLAILSMLATAASADPWLCAGEESTGFIFQNGKWEQAKFNVENEKYILRKLKEGEHFFGAKKQTYGLFTIGNDMSGLPCDDLSQPGMFICLSSSSEFKFSTKSGRFLMTHTSGYWDGKDDTESATFIAIGRCSKI
jgi:hypothetical protein